ncbi:hypothetical protein ACYSNM_03625 [Myroides sp. LJL116]
MGCLDVFGLDELVYQLLDKNGNVVYYGITSRTALDRLSEHERVKVFAHMETLAEGLNHDQARSMEGASIRNRINERLTSDQMKSLSIEDQLAKAGLLNVNRCRVE